MKIISLVVRRIESTIQYNIRTIHIISRFLALVPPASKPFAGYTEYHPSQQPSVQWPTSQHPSTKADWHPPPLTCTCRPWVHGIASKDHSHHNIILRLIKRAIAWSHHRPQNMREPITPGILRRLLAALRRSTS